MSLMVHVPQFEKFCMIAYILKQICVARKGSTEEGN